MKKPRIQIKPSKLSFADFCSSKSCVKPREKAKGEICIHTCCDNPNTYIRLEPIRSAVGRSNWKVYFAVETEPKKFVVFEPTYESFDDAGICVEQVQQTIDRSGAYSNEID